MLAHTAARWFPYLGDAVAVRGGGVTLTGATSKSDDTVVEVSAPLPGLSIGMAVETAWTVGEEVHRCNGRVEELLPNGGFTVRLTHPPIPESRRSHERVQLNVPVVLEQRRADGRRVPSDCSSLDVSNTGIRASLKGTSLQVGERVTLQVALGSRFTAVDAMVIWQDWKGFGQQVAGLRFDREIEHALWLEHVHNAS